MTHLGIGLGVGQQIQEEAARLLGPAALATRVLVLLGLGLAANAGGEVTEGHNVLVRNHIVQVLLRLLEALALDGIARLNRVLKVNAEVRALGLGDLLVLGGLNAVFPHDAAQRQTRRRTHE